MTHTAQIFAVAVAAAGAFVYGFFFIDIVRIIRWPLDRVKRFLRKQEEYKPKLQNMLISITTLLGFVLVMIQIVMFIIFPLIIFIAETFIVDIDVVVTDSKQILWLTVAIGFLFAFVGLLCGTVRSGKKDEIQESLDKKDEILPTIVEGDGSESKESKAFFKACEAHEVAKLLYKFEQVGFDNYGNARLVEKYHFLPFQTYKPPFVVFLNKDGSRVSLDGKNVFQGEEITSSENYASLLQKVVEKFSSESA